MDNKRSKMCNWRRVRKAMLSGLLTLALLLSSTSVAWAAETDAGVTEVAAGETDAGATDVAAEEMGANEALTTEADEKTDSGNPSDVSDTVGTASDTTDLTEDEAGTATSSEAEKAEEEAEVEPEAKAEEETKVEPEVKTENEYESLDDFDFDAWYQELMERVGEDGLLDPVLEQGREELVARFGEEAADEIMAIFDEGVSTFAAQTMPRFETPDHCPTDEEVYQTLMSYKNVDGYREGTRWTNHTPYGTEGPIAPDYIFQGGYQGFRRGVGCAGWVFLMSDANFGWMPGRLVPIAGNPQLHDGSGLTLDMIYDMIRPGDILRMANMHFVIIATKPNDGGAIITEANFNSSVHYGRAISKQDILNSEFFYTRHSASCKPMSAEDAGKTQVTTDASGNKIEMAGRLGTLDWRITNAGELIISGKGAIPDYEGKTEGMDEDTYHFELTNGEPPWYAYRENIEAITIEDGITVIGKNAFFNCQRLLRVTLPKTLTTINEGGFRETTLMSVTIPGNVKTVGKDAFRKCQSLTSVTLSEGIETLEDGAFRACTQLRAIVFPASIKKVGAAALFDCHELKSASFKESNITIEFGWDVFRRCWNMETIDLPKNMAAITPGMFATCMGLERIYIPASITEIGKPYGDKNAVGAQFPFTDAGFIRKEGMIYFGGTKEKWDQMVTDTNSPEMKQAMKDARIQFKVDYADPYKNSDSSKDLIDDTKAHEHKWSTTAWESDVYGHWRACEVMGCDVMVNDQKGGYAKHDYPTEYVIDKPADVGVIGSQHRDCKICKYREVQTIAAKRLIPIDVPVNVTINTNAGAATATLDKTKVEAALDTKKDSANDTKTLDVRVDATGKSEKACRVTIPTAVIAAVNAVNDGTYNSGTSSYINAKPVSYVVQSDAGTVKIAHADIYYASRLGYNGDKDVRIDIVKQTAADVPKTEDAAGNTVNVEGATVVKIEILKDGTTLYTENKSERPFEISAKAPEGAVDGDYATVYYVNPNEKNVLTKVTDHVKVEGGEVDFSVNHFTQFVIVKDANAPVDTRIPETHNHDWATVWTTNTTHHWHNCLAMGCDVKDVAAKNGYGGHVAGEWKVTKQATKTEKGLKEQQCKTCAYVMVREEIAMLTDETTPTEPTKPGTTEPTTPSKPGVTDPTEPSKPGVTDPTTPTNPNPGTTEPTTPETPKPTEPTAPGTTNPGTNPGTSNPGTTEPSKPSMTDPSKPGTTEPEKPSTGTSENEQETGDDTENETETPAVTKAEATKQMKAELATQLEKQLTTQVKTQLNKQLATQLKTQLAKELKKYAGKNLTAKQKAKLEKKLKAKLKLQLRAKLKAKLSKDLRTKLTKELKAKLKKQYGTQIGGTYNAEFDKQFKAKYSKLFEKSFKQYEKLFATQFAKQFKSQYAKVVAKK